MSTPKSTADDALYARALALWEQGDVAPCEAILRDLVGRDPRRVDASQLLAQLLRSQARLEAASALAFELCREHDFDADLSLRSAQFMQQCQRQALADELCDASVARHAPSAAMLAVAGNIARETGAFAKARERYLAALAAGIDLDTSFVLGALAHTQRYADAEHADFALFHTHFQRTNSAPRARAATGFGLAKAYDDIGDLHAAAKILRQANGLVRTTLAWSAAQWREFVAARLRETPARAGVAPSTPFVPVFVLGLPRTGTTLTATRLAAHAQVRDRGELRILRHIAEQLVGGNHLHDAEAIDEAAALYFAHARQDDAPATWYIDQDPLNFRYLHLIAALFPQARVIHCRRGRRDTALSLWSQDFAHQDCAFAYDFAAIADYAAGHDTLMAHWRDTLALPIHTLDYEDLVADPQATIAAARRFIGMPESGAGPIAAAAPINTASVWQARQPIYTRSVGRWRGYAADVPELEQLFPA